MDARVAAAVAVLLVAAAIAPFLVSASGAGDTRAVAFEDTRKIGLSDRALATVRANGLAVPKAQVYYPQYRYVVGYYGVTTLIAGLQSEHGSLGEPLAVYVTDFAGTDVTVSEDGYLKTPTGVEPGWMRAADAYFVVNSSARVPTRNETVVPFAERAAARTFARQYNGDVRRWGDVRHLDVPRASRSVAEWRRETNRRTARANRTVGDATELLDRPTSRTVTPDNASLARAIERAAPNTTVRLEAGTYNVSDLHIGKPLTLRGAGRNETHLVGDRNGSVLTVTAPRTAFANLSISGVGSDRSGDGDTVSNVSVPRDSSKFRFYKVHGYGDAAIVFDEADGGLVSNVAINTTSNGVIARGSKGTVVSNLSLVGTKRWDDGFLGVSALGEPVVVQGSTFLGGKVGVYAYDAPGVVVRNTRMEGMMVGIFDLYAPRLTALDNRVTDTWNAIYAETRSYGAVVIDNYVGNSQNGIVVEGRSNYLARNTAVRNTHGIQVISKYSVYRRNVLAYNTIGARSSSLLPTNNVTRNDFVGNARHVSTQAWNVRHAWERNYWSGAPGTDWDGDGTLSRAFRPTAPIDSAAVDHPGPRTLSRSPALALLRRVQQVVPGLQTAGVVDPTPLADPISQRGSLISEEHNETGQYDDGDPWTYTG